VAAEVMAALVYRRHGDEALRIVQSDARCCAIEYRRRGWTEAQTYSFSIEDAHRAGLLSGNAWQKYPAAMLRARCISAVARMAFPDVIGGLYTPEELGGAVQVVEDAVVPGAADEPPAMLSDRDLPPTDSLRAALPSGPETPAAATLERIEHMRRVRAVWYGEDEALPVPRRQEDADRAIGLLRGLLRLAVPEGDRALTAEQGRMLREAARELARVGADPGALPDALTRAQGYRLYKDLVRRRATHLSVVRGGGTGTRT
jgi:RecT family protein